jgi:hypothetical protein
MKNDFKNSTVDLTHAVKGKIQFDIYHNLPDTPGLSLSDAISNWVVRTKKYDAASLCNYINSKRSMTGHEAYVSKEQYEKLKRL